MYLLAHNAHLLSVDSPATPADTGLGIVGDNGTNKWTGDVQAYIDEDVVEVVRNGQRTQLYNTIVDLPANFPLRPDSNDLLTFRYLDGATETLQVRMVDGGLKFSAAKLRVICRHN